MTSLREWFARAWESCLTRVGGWRTHLFFVLAGFASLNWVFGRSYGSLVETYHRIFVTHLPSELIGVAAPIAMIFVGPRVGLLGVTALASAWLLFVDGPRYPGITHPAERLVLLLIPLYALITHAIYAASDKRGGRDGSAGGGSAGGGSADGGSEGERLEAGSSLHAERAERVEISFIAFLRVATLVIMAFLALHKFNRDFLDPTLSCQNFVMERLAQWAVIGEFAVRVSSPHFALASEAMMAVLLVLRPRIGILYVSLLLTTLWLAAFGRIAVLVIALSFSFLEPGDRERLLRNRRNLLKISSTIAAIYVCAILFVPYRGALTSTELLAYGAFLSAAIGSMIVLIGCDRRESGGLIPGSMLRIAWPRDRWNRALVALSAVTVFAACISPYFGLKFEYSFAMYSNLRTDAYRWNSYVFPEWMRVFDHDVLYVERSRVLRDEVPLAESDPIEGMIFQPEGLIRRVVLIRDAAAGDEAIRHELVVGYRGQRFEFRNTIRGGKWLAFIQQLPRAQLYWRQELTGRAPQTCVH